MANAKPTRLTLNINQIPGGYHNLHLLGSPSVGATTAPLLEDLPFEGDQLRQAVDAALTLMQQHRIQLVHIVDPGKKLLAANTSADLKATQLRSYATALSRA